MSQEDFEVVIVDDKRTKSLDIVHEYKGKIKNLRIIVEEKHHDYPIIPRKHAIDNARGIFVMLMDQDDNLADDTLMTFDEFMV